MKARWAALLLFALPACGGVWADEDGGPGMDFLDASPPPSIDAGSLTGDVAEYDDARAGFSAPSDACFDGADNDGDGSGDCADISCQQNVRSCCVGATGSTCCADGPSETLPLATCAGPLGVCVDASAIAVFGSPVPRVREIAGSPAFLPGGQTTDGGALFLREFDPRSGVTRIEATLESSDVRLTGGQVEAVAVGFVDASQDVTVSRVAPVVGVLLSRNRAAALVIVAGETVAEWPRSDGPVTYAVEIDPAGVVRVSSDVETLTFPYSVERTVRAIVYGRTANPDALDPAPARLTHIQITQERCDMPSALHRSAETVVPAPLDGAWALTHPSIERPHVLRWDEGGVSQVRMALLVDGEVHLAEPGADGFILLSTPGDPVLPPPTEVWALDGIDHPRLRRSGGVLELWFTGYADGRGTVGRAVWDDVAASFRVVGPVPGLVATDTISYSAAAPFTFGVEELAVARVDDGDGQRLVLYGIDAAGATERLVVHQRDGDLFAFDRDELDAPAALEFNGVLRIYYAGRRGTRWGLGIFATDDLVLWHRPVDGSLFSAGQSTFDGLGVRDPSLDVVGEEVHLYYTGDDGARTRIGRAIGPRPPRR